MHQSIALLDDRPTTVVSPTDRHGTALAVFPGTPFDPFFNVNTPEDLTLAEGLLA